jgi:hypothetical protein
MLGMLLRVGLVEVGQQIEVLALMLAGDTFHGLKVQDRRTFGPQRRALKMGRQEAVAPVGSSPLRIRHLRQHQEAWQVLIERAQAVGYPGANGRIAAEAVAGVHLVHGRGMIHGIDLAATVEADVVRTAGEVLPVRSDIGAALARLAEGKRTLHKVAFAALHGRLRFPFADELLQV